MYSSDRLGALAVAVAAILLSSCLAGSVAGCKIATYTGGTGAMIAASILVYSIFNARIGYNLIVGMIFTVSLVDLLKNLLGTERPPEELWMVAAEGPAFPSGHAAAAAAFWTLLAYNTRNPYIAMAGALHAISVALSRPFLWVHWPIDILGGGIIGVGMALLSQVLLARFGPVVVLASSLALNATSLALSGLNANTALLTGITLGMLPTAVVKPQYGSGGICGLAALVPLPLLLAADSWSTALAAGFAGTLYIMYYYLLPPGRECITRMHASKDSNGS